MKLLAFSASLRSDSLNYKLVRKIAESIEDKGDHTVMVVNLKDFELPFYDGDIEMEIGLPENAKKFKEILNHMDGLVISCPEYNGGISAVMKNFIDWVSRKVRIMKQNSLLRIKLLLSPVLQQARVVEKED